MYFASAVINLGCSNNTNTINDLNAETLEKTQKLWLESRLKLIVQSLNTFKIIAANDCLIAAIVQNNH